LKVSGISAASKYLIHSALLSELNYVQGIHHHVLSLLKCQDLFVRRVTGHPARGCDRYAVFASALLILLGLLILLVFDLLSKLVKFGGIQDPPFDGLKLVLIAVKSYLLLLQVHLVDGGKLVEIVLLRTRLFDTVGGCLCLTLTRLSHEDLLRQGPGKADST